MSTEKHYELKIGATEVLLRVEPPEAGKRANLNDIQKELRELDISFRMDHLFDIYRRSSNQFETLTTRESEKYEILVQVSPTGQEATMTVIPPQKGQDELTPTKIKNALDAAKVEKGVLYPELKRIMAEKVENKPVVIARGKPAVQGVDGRVEFHLEQAGPKAAVEDNRVDYRELNLIRNVHEGDLIATIFPPTPGEDGFNVTGKVLKGLNGKRAKMRLGANAVMNEEGTEIHAGKAGYVVISEERVSIEDVLEVPNVDSASGNLRFSGVVRVVGQVADNFIVEADKGIEVGETVGKAILKTRGDIKIGGGAFAATLEAKKSINAKFFNECEVKAGESVFAQEYILHSQVSAGKTIQVKQAPDGFANGGMLRAGESIWVAVLGSQVNEERIAVEVGGSLGARRRLQELQEKIKSDQEQFDRLRKNLRVLQTHRETKGTLPEDQEQTFTKLLGAATALKDRMLEESREHQSLFTTLASQDGAESYVFVSNIAHPGTMVQVHRFKVNLNSPLESCAFRILNGELKAQDYGQAQKAYKMRHRKQTA